MAVAGAANNLEAFRSLYIECQNGPLKTSLDNAYTQNNIVTQVQENQIPNVGAMLGIRPDRIAGLDFEHGSVGMREVLDRVVMLKTPAQWRTKLGHLEVGNAIIDLNIERADIKLTLWFLMAGDLSEPKASIG